MQLACNFRTLHCYKFEKGKVVIQLINAGGDLPKSYVDVPVGPRKIYLVLYEDFTPLGTTKTISKFAQIWRCLQQFTQNTHNLCNLGSFVSETLMKTYRSLY